MLEKKKKKRKREKTFSDDTCTRINASELFHGQLKHDAFVPLIAGAHAPEYSCFFFHWEEHTRGLFDFLNICYWNNIFHIPVCFFSPFPWSGVHILELEQAKQTLSTIVRNENELPTIAFTRVLAFRWSLTFVNSRPRDRCVWKQKP